MKEEISKEAQPVLESSFWDEIDWDKVSHNKIDRGSFLRTKSLNSKIFATFLGPQDQLQFYLFKPLGWAKYKDIRSKDLDKDTVHEYIINACLIHPASNPIAVGNIDAGIMLTLVNQILTISNFLTDPNQALELLLEIK